MYTEEFVTEITNLYRKKEKDLDRAGEMYAKMLKEDPTKYYYFGPYWWAVKKLIKERTNIKAWFTEGYFDEMTYWRAWHGTELRTISASNYYLNEQIMKTNCHSVLIDGEEKTYTLFDEDAGF